jgi:hypothetical protein
MSSTSNVQNLLTNVFRPTFVYSAGTGYQSKLELVNIDSVSANTVTTFSAAVGDSSNNTYVGVNAGNVHSTLATSGNSNDTFLGTSAGLGTANVKSSVFLGYRAGVGAVSSSNSISIGAITPNGGNSNIYIGCGTGITTGSNNIFIGTGLTSATISNAFLVGNGANVLLSGDFTNKRLGVNLSTLPTFDPSVPILLDVNGYARVGTNNNGMLGVNAAPAYNLDVNGNMRVSEGYGTLTMTRDLSNNSLTTLAPVPYTGSTATIGVANGYYSAQGTMASTVDIRSIGLQVLPGSFVATAESADGAVYDYCTFYRRRAVYSAVTSTRVSNATLLSTSISGGLYLASNASNLKWSVAYFPSATVAPTLTLSSGVVTTLAGQATAGYSNAVGVLAQFSGPTGVAVVRSTGSVVVSDAANNRIRLITSGGSVSLLAGQTTAGSADGTGAAASFSNPGGVAVIPTNGYIVVCDTNNHRIRIVTPGGVVSTLAGGTAGLADGVGAAAMFNSPQSVAVDPVTNTIVVADKSNNRIRLVTYPEGAVTTLAGGSAGFADGLGANAKFNSPMNVSVNPITRVIAVADRLNNRIRLVTPAGNVTTLAGQTTAGSADGNGVLASFNQPYGVCVIPTTGSILVADKSNNMIRLVTPAGDVTTFVGQTTAGFTNATGASAQFNGPFSVCVDPGADVAYIADFTNNTIRKTTLPYS